MRSAVDNSFNQCNAFHRLRRLCRQVLENIEGSNGGLQGMRRHKSNGIKVILLVIATAMCAWTAHSRATQNRTATSPGIHDFDFEFGNWQVHHRLERPDGRWIEFDGVARARPLIDGSADIEEHTFSKPTGRTYGIGLRAFDRKAGTWAIWWVDSRSPHLPVDPPNVGRFRDGVGTFFSDSIIDGKTVRTRYIWSHITHDGARWEQAISTDRGSTWETNWIMEFRRVP